MTSSKCCVLNCDSVDRKLVFPEKDKEFKIWIERCNNQKLYELDKSKIRYCYAVYQHFEKYCESLGTNKLKKGSLPTLYFPTSDIHKNYCNIIYVCKFV